MDPGAFYTVDMRAGQPKHELELWGLVDAHAFKHSVWGMKRRVAGSAPAPGRPMPSPSQMEMQTKLLTDTWHERFVGFDKCLILWRYYDFTMILRFCRVLPWFYHGFTIAHRDGLGDPRRAEGAEPNDGEEVVGYVGMPLQFPL